MRLPYKLDQMQMDGPADLSIAEFEALLDIARAAYAMRYASEPADIREPRLDRAMEALEEL